MAVANIAAQHIHANECDGEEGVKEIMSFIAIG